MAEELLTQTANGVIIHSQAIPRPQWDLVSLVRIQQLVLSSLTAALLAFAAFHRRVHVLHVEAGLRTHRLDAPFPEELNRRRASTRHSSNR